MRVVGRCLSVVVSRLSGIGCWLCSVGCLTSVFVCWLSVVGSWWMVVGYRQLAGVCWLFVIGFWLKIVGCLFLFIIGCLLLVLYVNWCVLDVGIVVWLFFGGRCFLEFVCLLLVVWWLCREG